MKRLLILMLAAALALFLAACGDKRDYSTDFTGMLNIASFDMTEDDVIALESGAGYETKDLGDSRLLTFDNGHSYRFSAKDGSFEVVKWALSNDWAEVGLEMWETVVDEGLKNWTGTCGKPGIDEKIYLYSWYGNVDGEKASLSVTMGIKNAGLSMMKLNKSN